MKLSLLPRIDPSLLGLPIVGLNPLIPVKVHGIRILPPMSVPNPKGEHLAAINPASPPELPPHDLALFQGF